MEDTKYFIATNVDGCLYADYYAELLSNKDDAKEIFEKCHSVDPNAKMFEMKGE